MHDALTLSGHFAYVWSAWGLGALLLVALFIQSLRARSRVKQNLKMASRMAKERA